MKENGARAEGGALAIAPARVSVRSLVVLAAAVFFARLAISIAIGWNITDEAWNLHVVDRFLHGETLYRDIYFGVTPLPVYVAALACLLFGVQAVVLKALSAAVFAGIFLAVFHVLRLAGSTVKAWPIAVLIALVPISPYNTSALYNDLSPLSILLVAAATLQWRKSPGIGRAIWLGVLLGVCFVSKQNTGIYGAMAVAAVLLLSPGTTLARRCGHLLVAGLSAAIVVTIVLLPIALAGGWDDMIVQCFTNKGNYMRHGISFLDGFRDLAASVRDLPKRRAIVTCFWSMIFPLALVAPVMFAVGLIRKPTRGSLTVLPFLLVIAATIYPRAGLGPVARAFPAILIALVLAAPAFPRSLMRVLSTLGLGGAGLALGVLLLLVPSRMLSSRYVFSTLPHTRGVLLHVDEQARLHRLSAAVAAQPGPTFILSTEAGALYLISGVENPTMHGYPLINTFPSGTQEKVIESMDRGRIRSVVFQTYFPPSLLPGELADHVTKRCHPVSASNGYQFYLTQPPAATGTGPGEPPLR